MRALGPAFTAAFQPLRLLSTVAASALWLREPVRGAAEWLGLTLVLGSMSAYLLYDMVCRPRAARANGAAESGFDDSDDGAARRSPTTPGAEHAVAPLLKSGELSSA